MKLEDLNAAIDKDALKLVEEIDGRLVDGRFCFNQRDTAKLLGLTARAFADWPIEPIRRVGREKFYYWFDVLELAVDRYGAQRSRR